MGLFIRFGRHTNSFEESLDHLTAEGELPWGWISANEEFTERIQSEERYFFNAWRNPEEKSVLKEYAALKSHVLYLNNAQKLCASKGECFSKWFSDIIADQNYIDKLTEKVKNMEAEMDDLLKAEKRTKHIEQNILPTLRKDLIASIKSEPGIFQVDLFKRYDADLKPFIHTELYKLELEGLLVKEKEGRRNRLFMKK